MLPQLFCIAVAWAAKKLYLCHTSREILRDKDLPAGALDRRAEPVGGPQAAGVAEQERFRGLH
jgi:hypothetical protein